jgi:hypothetical protein
MAKRGGFRRIMVREFLGARALSISAMKNYL